MNNIEEKLKKINIQLINNNDIDKILIIDEIPKIFAFPEDYLKMLYKYEIYIKNLLEYIDENSKLLDEIIKKHTNSKYYKN